jgi:hypothetical protein
VTVAAGVGVIIDATGHLGTTTSSARFKTQIHPMGHDSDSILSMQPVSFRYKKEVADNSVAQFGLVAEEVEKVAPDLVVRDDDGKPYSVRYEAVNAMLLNEFLKEHEKVEAQKKALEEQANTIQRLEAGLEKVNARLDANGL